MFISILVSSIPFLLLGSKTFLIMNLENYSFDNFLLLAVVIIVLIAIAYKFLKSSSYKNYIKYQSSLPTSKIKSLSMGLVEVCGELIQKESLISPIGKEECVGYLYIIEEVYKDSNGKDSYREIHKEFLSNVFGIRDETGEIDVYPEGLDLIMFDTSDQNYRSGKRYTEYVLKPGKKMILIGYADVKENSPFIKEDTFNNVFGIAFFDKINLWNKYYHLLEAFLVTSFIIAIFTILIILN